MKGLTKLTTTIAVALLVVFAASGAARADGPHQCELVTYANGFEYRQSVDESGMPIMIVTDLETRDNHIHPMPIYGFWGTVTNRGAPVSANVAASLLWNSNRVRRTKDTRSCPRCGFWSMFCNVESGFGMMANLNTGGGHTPLLTSGYRCADELMQIDFEFDIMLFYAKVCENIEPYPHELEFFPAEP